MNPNPFEIHRLYPSEHCYSPLNSCASDIDEIKSCCNHNTSVSSSVALAAIKVNVFLSDSEL
ncbi:hypothetical protein HanIR_Chr10g0474081 [Helianthus annuus]|nr:hypothetical protein HanIR_Chr10g0474081 [Helianthus annuus]